MDLGAGKVHVNVRPFRGLYRRKKSVFLNAKGRGVKVQCSQSKDSVAQPAAVTPGQSVSHVFIPPETVGDIFDNRLEIR